MLGGTRDAFSISGVAMGSQGFGSIDWNIRVLGFYRIEHIASFKLNVSRLCKEYK